MCWETSPSKHFYHHRRESNGPQVFWACVSWCFGGGIMIANFRQAGMVARVRERLKIFVRIPESCS